MELCAGASMVSLSPILSLNYAAIRAQTIANGWRISGDIYDVRDRSVSASARAVGVHKHDRTTIGSMNDARARP